METVEITHYIIYSILLLLSIYNIIVINKLKAKYKISKETFKIFANRIKDQKQNNKGVNSRFKILESDLDNLKMEILTKTKKTEKDVNSHEQLLKQLKLKV